MYTHGLVSVGWWLTYLSVLESVFVLILKHFRYFCARLGNGFVNLFLDKRYIKFATQIDWVGVEGYTFKISESWTYSWGIECILYVWAQISLLVLSDQP